MFASIVRFRASFTKSELGLSINISFVKLINLSPSLSFKVMFLALARSKLRAVLDPSGGQTVIVGMESQVQRWGGW